MCRRILLLCGQIAVIPLAGPGQRHLISYLALDRLLSALSCLAGLRIV